MNRLASCAVAVIAFLGPVAAAFGQGAVLQGGSWSLGHLPAYTSQSGQTIVIDSGPARGGPVGSGVSELAMIARGVGTPPYIGQGTGPNGSPFCMYDAPIDNANGYHYLCLSANATVGGPVISVGFGGIASPLPLQFIINGVTVTGVTCSGSPTSSFASVSGIVTHC